MYDVRDGWEPLCKFLDVPVPNESFPRVNEAGAMRAMYFGFMAFGLCTWALYAVALAGLGYLAMRPEVVNRYIQVVSKWVSRE